MIIELNGKTFQGNNLGSILRDGVEFKMMKMRPIAREKYVVIRVLDNGSSSVHYITGYDQFERFYSHIENSQDAGKLINELLSVVQNNPAIAWKTFYDEHYPEFVYGGVTWDDFKDAMKQTQVA